LFEIATVPGPGYVCIYNPLKDEGNSTGLDDSILGESIGDFNGGSAMEVRHVAVDLAYCCCCCCCYYYYYCCLGTFN
jgi:hypothetical protein